MGKTAVMFTSQAAQFKGMGKDVYKKYAVAQKLFRKASDIYGDNLAEIAFMRSPKELNKTHNAQMAITLLNIIFYRLYIEREHEPDTILGLSVGEPSALCAAGIISEEDLFRFITIRGKSMHADALNNRGSMYAVRGLSDDEIEQILEEYKKNHVITISGYNSNNQTIISGDSDAIKLAVDKIRMKNGEAKNLKQEGAWHTRHMSGAETECRKFLADLKLKKPRIPVVFNLTAGYETDLNRIKQYMTEQIVRPVQWKQSLHLLKEQGVDTFYEIGVGKILRGLVIDNYREYKDYRYTLCNVNSCKSVEQLEAKVEQRQGAQKSFQEKKRHLGA